MERVDNKRTLVKLKFPIKVFNKLSNEEIKRLSETAQDFYHFIEIFEKLNNLQNYVELWLLEDPLQKSRNFNMRSFSGLLLRQRFLTRRKNQNART